MLFSLNDVWYVILLKVSIFVIAIVMLINICYLSTLNACIRVRLIRADLDSRDSVLIKAMEFIKNTLALILNMIILYGLFLSLLVLSFGFVGISISQLLDFGLYKCSLMLTLSSLLLAERFKLRIIK